MRVESKLLVFLLLTVVESSTSSSATARFLRKGTTVTCPTAKTGPFKGDGSLLMITSNKSSDCKECRFSLSSVGDDDGKGGQSDVLSCTCAHLDDGYYHEWGHGADAVWVEEPEGVWANYHPNCSGYTSCTACCKDFSSALDGE